MKRYKIAVLPGDGVGVEVIEAALKVLSKVEEKFEVEFEFKKGLVGAAAIEKTNSALPEETKQLVLEADAILFGAVGDPKYDKDPKAKVRPEQGILGLRKLLNLYLNIRPIKTYSCLYHKSPLKKEVVEGVDFIVVRELTGGIYFGEPRGRSEDGQKAFDTMVYSRFEIRRAARVAFELAKQRRKTVALVDKANVLATSRLWREEVEEFASKNYPEVELKFYYVDNAAMQVLKRPSEFDVILTSNMFGDILTDEASVIAGSLGMLPSASLGEKDGRRRGLFEPIHGSYPKAAGKNIANPTGAILSAAEMLRFLKEYKAAVAVERAVDKALKDKIFTRDIDPENYYSCSEFAEKVAERI